MNEYKLIVPVNCPNSKRISFVLNNEFKFMQSKPYQI